MLLRHFIMLEASYYKCLDLANSTGYVIIQTNGQRIYQRPNDQIQPKKGSEIFVGKLPRDLFEDEIVPLFNKIGPIHQVRLMIDFCGKNRGYCFISYYLPAHANSAIAVLNGFEIRPKRRIGVYKSIDNCRLFIGGLPVNKTKAEVRQCFEEYVEGIVDIIMYPSRENWNYNRGYAFIEFQSHRHAAMARRSLSPGSLILWNVPILVDWADPIPDVDPMIMNQVKKLYIRNLHPNLTADDLHQFLTNFVHSSTVYKIHKSLDYAFVHFSNRKSAELCLNSMKGKVLANLKIEATWARPKMYSKAYRIRAPINHFCSSLPPILRKQVILNKKSAKTDAISLPRFDFFMCSNLSNESSII